MKTLIHQEKSSPLSSVQIWFKAGSALETQENMGIAHFLEHMFFKGSKKYPHGQIAKIVEGFGGEINAFTSFDYTCYYINCPAKYTLKSLDLLLDMVTHPLFQEKDLIPERDVVTEEFLRSQDSPQSFYFSHIQKKYFSHSYRHQILGTKKSISAFSIKQLQDFRKKYYSQKNCLISIFGSFNETAINKKIKEFSLPQGKKNSFPAFNLKKRQGFTPIEKDVHLAKITVLIPGLQQSDLQAPIEDLAISYLTNGESSPLKQNLIFQNQLAESCSSSTLYLARGSQHSLSFSFPLKKYLSCTSAFFKVLTEVIYNPLHESELNKIKKQYLAEKIYQRESMEELAFNRSYWKITECSEERFYKIIEQITSYQLKQALINIFSRHLNITGLFPIGSTEKIKLPHVVKEQEQFSKKVNSLLKSKSSKKKIKSKDNLVLKEIKKGIHLLHIHNPRTPSFHSSIYTQGGLGCETPTQNGIHYFISKIFNYGHQECSHFSFSQKIEQLAANVKGFSGRNAYGINTHGLSENTATLIKESWSCFLRPCYNDNKIIKQQKESISNIINSSKKDPATQCLQLFQKSIFNKSSYALPTVGNLKNITSFSSTLIKKVHEKNIKNAKILFSYSGPQGIDEIEELLQDETQSLKPRSGHDFPPFRNVIQPFKKEIIFSREQCHIFMGVPTFNAQDKRNLSLKVLTHYFSGQGSILFRTARDELGLCYTVQPLHMSAIQSGFWGIYIATDHSKVHTAIEAIKNILSNLCKKGIPRVEIKKIQQALQNEFAMNITTNQDFIETYSIDALHFNSITQVQDNLQQIKALEGNEINKFVQSFLKQEFSIVMTKK